MKNPGRNGRSLHTSLVQRGPEGGSVTIALVLACSGQVQPCCRRVRAIFADAGPTAQGHAAVKLLIWRTT